MLKKLRAIAAIIPVLIIASAATAQDRQYRAAESDKWENYLASEYKFSIMFPRSPVRVFDTLKECFGRRTVIYAIYKDGVAYGVNVTYKINPPNTCLEKSSFSPDDFKTRLEDFAESKREKTPALIKGARAEQYRSDAGLVRLYNDPKNDRWFELSVQGKLENNTEIAKFFESFVTGKDISGTEIGEGWSNLQSGTVNLPTNSVPANTDASGVPRTGSGTSGSSGVGMGPGFGDGTGEVAGPAKGPAKGVMLITQPKPPYTKEARQAQIQGTVVLRVTFYANGRIGSITPIKGLGYGLTEEAIKTATRIVFIPGSREEVPITMTKAVQYNFSLH